MLARLDVAMASAEAEVMQSSALEDYLRRLHDNLEAEQARLDENIRAAVLTHDNSPGPVLVIADDDATRLQHLREQMTRILAVQNKLHHLLSAPDHAGAQHP
jgi:hypothetical protein